MNSVSSGVKDCSHCKGTLDFIHTHARDQIAALMGIRRESGALNEMRGFLHSALRASVEMTLLGG